MDSKEKPSGINTRGTSGRGYWMNASFISMGLGVLMEMVPWMVDSGIGSVMAGVVGGGGSPVGSRLGVCPN